jgi:5-methyltetrahydropteroyltriglutamate--homocysteine methyltransferase
MKRSERFLTTHTGSLPRPDDVLALVRAVERGEPSVQEALRARLRSAVAEIVRQQIEAKVDVVSDGELSKPGYSTYVKSRLTGFEGEDRFPALADMAEFPRYAARELGREALRSLRTPACTGPVRYVGHEALTADIDNLKAAILRQPVEEAFLTAASPGVISLFLQNQHYPSHEAYLEALAEAMRTEYEAIASSGLLLQVDCPDLAMGRHIQYAHLDLAGFRRQAALHVEALNHALARVPSDRVRIHLCWANYEGPHHHDVELRDILDIVLSVRASGVSFVAANPRHEHEWKVWASVVLPEDKTLIPGVIDSTTNFIEHPDLIAERLERFAAIVGPDRVMAGTDCGFSTFAGLYTVDPAIAWAKLESLAEGALRASMHLSGQRKERRESEREAHLRAT